MIIQLHPAIPLKTPKGNALAHFLIDYGEESHLLWVCFQDETGECWTWSNPDIRAQKNESVGRKLCKGEELGDFVRKHNAETDKIMEEFYAKLKEIKDRG